MGNWRESKHGNRAPRWQDKLDLWEFKSSKLSGKWNKIRFIGEYQAVAQHWVKSKNNKSFPILCLNFDLDKEEFDDEKGCPVCELISKGKMEDTAKAKRFFVQNIIVRKLQKNPQKPVDLNKEGKKPKFRKMEDVEDIWSPIKVMQMTGGCSSKISKIMDLLGTDKEGELIDPSDPKLGCDLNFQFNGDSKGEEMYSFAKEEITPLTDVEKRYKLFDLKVFETSPISEIKKSLKTNGYYKEDSNLEELDEDDEDEKPSKSKSKPKDDEDDDLDDLDNDLDEDEDEDDDLDEDEDEDDEDEKPSKSKKHKKEKKKKKKKKKS